MKHDRLDALERYVPLFDEPGVPFDRFIRRRDRKRRNQRVVAGVVGISIFLAAVSIAVVEFEGGDSNRPVGGPTFAVPDPPLVPQIGLDGLAPEGMPPSLPVSGEIVVSFFFGHTGGDMGRFHVNVYEDGRMLWLRLGDPSLGTSSTGWIEQRLTPEGVEAMRTEVLATGLFEADTHFTGGRGLFFGDIKVQDGARVVRVTWGDIGVDEPPGMVPTEAQVSALNRLDARFADPASWLPPDAWRDPEMRPFVPSRYSACFGGEGASLGLGESLAPLPPMARHDIRAQGPRRYEYTNLVGTFSYWCTSLATDDAHALAAGLDAGDHTSRREDTFGLSYTFGVPEVWLNIEPTLPDRV